MKRLQETEETKECRLIVILFLQKLDIMTKEERAEILKMISILNHPLFVV